ncbi:MAG: type IV secretory system conjugative DNA transfer family protein [Actinomycetaceae bacterium]|nr:type IV secretory system conjugative DNA transfer family protein [Actinomycetaceae bacterium]
MRKINPSYVIIAIAALFAFWGGDKASWQVRTLHEGGMEWMEAFTHLLDDITNNPMHFSFHQTDLLVGLGTIAVLALIILYSQSQKKGTRTGEEYGSAGWGSAKDFKPFVAGKEKGIVLTAEHTLSLDTHKTGRNRNVLVYGSAGSGKSRYFVLPNLETCSTSFVVTDPKGELLRQSGEHLVKNGYKIRCLNLVDFTKSDRFNPFAYFDESQPEISISILVNNIITNTTGGKPQGDQAFWERAEKALLTALITYAYFENPENASLVDVAHFLSTMNNKARDKKSEQEESFDEEIIYSAINAKAARDGQSDIYTLWQANGILFAHSQYDIYTKGATETRQSVVISLGVRLASLYMAPMQALVGGVDEIRIDDIGREKTALFLVLPDTHTTFNWLAAVFYQQLFETLIAQADSNENGALDVSVQCFMDEFANIGQIPDFDRKIAVMRSRGISASVILQSDAQGKSLYKDDWETIIGNCDSVLFLGGQEKSTTELISRLLGKQTIRVKNHHEAVGMQGSSSRQWQKTGRELLTQDELARLDNRECIYILRGIKPFKAHKHAPAKMKGAYVHAVERAEEQLAVHTSDIPENYDEDIESGRSLMPAPVETEELPEVAPTDDFYEEEVLQTHTREQEAVTGQEAYQLLEDEIRELENAIPGWQVTAARI